MSFDPAYPLVVFLHIPKTAGTTLRETLLRNYKSNRMIWVKTAPPSHEDQILNAIIKSSKGLQLIAGHARYGVHEFAAEDAAYFTFLRHPFSRVFSFYHYILTTAHHPYYETLRKSGGNFLDFLNNPDSPEVLNQQTRLISGCRTAPHETSREELELAKKHLREKFFMVGLQEQFDDSMALLKLTLGLKDVAYMTQKINKAKPVFPLDDVVQEALKRTNALDLELYEYGKELFDEQMLKYKGRIGEVLRVMSEERSTYRHHVKTALKSQFVNFRKFGRKIRKKII